MTDAPPLRDMVAQFLRDHSMSPVTFGRKAMNDPHFVRDLENGRRLFPETEAKVRAFIAEHNVDAPAEAA